MPSFLASLDVSLSMRMSPILTGPMMFLVMILPLSRPSSTRTLTWVASPVIPVLPMTSTALADVGDGDGSGGLLEADGVAELRLAGDVDVGDLLLLAEGGDVGEDLRGLDIGGHDDDDGVSALDGLGHLVGALLDLPAVPGDLRQGVGLVRQLFGCVKFDEYRHFNYLFQVRKGTLIIHRLLKSGSPYPIGVFIGIGSGGGVGRLS